MNNHYHIEDEPHPGMLAQFATNPLWPLLGVMLGGVWLGWSWFVFNSFAVGSPTRWRESVWIVGGLLVSGVLISLSAYLADTHIIEGQAQIHYALLVLTVWKLAVSYAVFTLQSRTIELYEYYGGVLRNGIWVVALAMLFGRAAVIGALPDYFLKLLLG